MDAIEHLGDPMIACVSGIAVGAAEKVHSLGPETVHILESLQVNWVFLPTRLWAR
jgi:hypothetical protein